MLFAGSPRGATPTAAWSTRPSRSGPAAYEFLQKAISHTTLCLERGKRPDADELLNEIVHEEMTDDPHWEIKTLLGMQNLAMILLVRLENATGASPEATLQDIAQRYRPPD